MLRVISSVEAVERLKAAGFNTNVNRLNAGLRQVAGKPVRSDDEFKTISKRG